MNDESEVALGSFRTRGSEDDISLFIVQHSAFIILFQPSSLRIWSGRRDLNSRPSPWQGDALPLSYSRFEILILRIHLMLSSEPFFETVSSSEFRIPRFEFRVSGF